MRGPPISYDRLIKNVLRGSEADLVQWLLGKRPRAVQEVKPETTSINLRVSDTLFGFDLEDGSLALLHVEFQIEGDVEMPYRMAEYAALLARAHRRRQAQLASVVVYLDRSMYRQDPGELKVQGLLGWELHHKYHVLKIWELDPRRVLALGSAALLPFIPLMAGAPEDLLIQSRDRILRLPQKVASLEAKQELLQVLGGLASRVIDDRNLILRVLSEFGAMKKTGLFEMFLEQGLKEGKVKGLAEGKAEGRVDGIRQGILRILSKRFGKTPDGLRRALAAHQSVKRLEHLLDKALDCPSLEAFRSAL